MIDRRALILATAAAGLPGGAGASAAVGGAHDFDFQVGDWQVRHRYLRKTAQGPEWRETDGTCRMRAFAGEWGNLEEHVIQTADGFYQAMGLRAYDAATGLWALWWLDGRDPFGAMDPPLKGRFENGVGTFFADTETDGKSTRARIIWSQITPTSARWEQANSHDAGQTWETNWVMQFERASPANPIAPPPAPVVDKSGVRDFDFQVGVWDVRHHRQLPNSAEWVDFGGTCSLRLTLGGQGNMEQHVIRAPRGTYRAVSLRAFDPAKGQWAIRWLDQRYPSGPIDPAVAGRFEGGVGNFYSDYDVDGKPARGRLQWSQITAGSAHWEQAQSLDAGRTWATTWTMEFRRRRAAG